MVLVEVVDVFSGNHVDLGVPVAVERLELFHLGALLFREVGKILEYDVCWHSHKGNVGRAVLLSGRVPGGTEILGPQR